MGDAPTDEFLPPVAEGRNLPQAILSGPILIWVVLTTAFFYIRFSFVFYDAHKESISALIDRVFGI